MSDHNKIYGIIAFMATNRSKVAFGSKIPYTFPYTFMFLYKVFLVIPLFRRKKE